MKNNISVKRIFKLILLLNIMFSVTISFSRNPIIGKWKMTDFKFINHPKDCTPKKLNYLCTIMKNRTWFYFFNNMLYVDYSVDGLELGTWKYTNKEKIIVKKACNGKLDTLKLTSVSFREIKGTYSSKEGFYLYFEMKKSILK